MEVIFCGHFLSNTQSQRVQEKCGFKHYAFGTYQTQFDTVEDDETNILTREDWLAARRAGEQDVERSVSEDRIV